MKAMSVALSLLPLFAQSQPAFAYERWLRIHNESSFSVCEIYIVHVGTNRWGADLLGYDCLPPDSYIVVDPGWQQGYCMMDMLFVWSDGTTSVRQRYNICEGTDYYLTD